MSEPSGASPWPEPSLAEWHGDDGVIRPPRGMPVPLDDVPPSTEVRLHLQGGGSTITATSMGAGSKLVLSADAGSSVAVPSAVRVVHLVSPLPGTVHLSGPVNLHVLAPGTINVVAAPDAPSDVSVRLWSSNPEASAGSITLSSGVGFASIVGESDAAITLQATAGLPAEKLVQPGAEVRLSGSLTVEGSLAGCHIEVAGELSVHRLTGECTVEAASVRIGSVDRTGRTWTPSSAALVEAGSHIEVTGGDLLIAGAVQGTDDAPVRLIGAHEREVKVGAADHCTIAARADEELSSVTLGATAHTVVEHAATVTAQAPGDKHRVPNFRTARSIALAGTCYGGYVRADDIRVGTVVGPIHVEGRTVTLGTMTAGSDEAFVTTIVGEWLIAGAAAAVDLRTENPEGASVAIGQALAQRPHGGGPSSLPDDLLAADPMQAGVDRATTDTPARMRLGGKLRVQSTVASLRIEHAEDVIALWCAGEVEVTADGHISQVRVETDLTLSEGATLSVDALQARTVTGGEIEATGLVKADSISRTRVSSAALEVTTDVTSAVLGIRERTSIGGRLLQGDVEPAPVATLAGNIDLGPVDVPLVLNTAEGTISRENPATVDTVTIIPCLDWTRSAGDLRLAHGVERFTVRDPAESCTLILGSSASVSSLSSDGPLRIAATPAKDVDITGPETLQLENGADVHVDGVTGGVIRLADSAVASLTVEQAGARFALASDPESGRLVVRAPNGSHKRDDDLGPQPTLELRSDQTSDGPAAPQPTMDLQAGDIRLVGAFSDVLVSQPDVNAPTTIYVPRDGVVHRMRGRVAIGELHGRVTAAQPKPGPLFRFSSPSGPRGPRLGGIRQWLLDRLGKPSSDEDRLVLVDAQSSVERERTTRGVLVGPDVTLLSFGELQRLDDLDVFSPDPISLERQARRRFSRDADRQSSAQKLSRIAELVDGRSVTGSVRSMTHWAASTAHGATARKAEWAGRAIARRLGYGQRPLPPLALLSALVVGLTWALSTTAWEASACELWFDDMAGAEDVGSYSWLQHLERVLLAPLAFLRVAGSSDLQPLGCSALLQVVGTIAVAVPLAFAVLGLRNYLRSPVER